MKKVERYKNRLKYNIKRYFGTINGHNHESLIENKYIMD
jgi:hypothetical protein